MYRHEWRRTRCSRPPPRHWRPRKERRFPPTGMLVHRGTPCDGDPDAVGCPVSLVGGGARQREWRSARATPADRPLGHHTNVGILSPKTVHARVVRCAYIHQQIELAGSPTWELTRGPPCAGVGAPLAAAGRPAAPRGGPPAVSRLTVDSCRENTRWRRGGGAAIGPARFRGGPCAGRGGVTVHGCASASALARRLHRCGPRRY